MKRLVITTRREVSYRSIHSDNESLQRHPEKDAQNLHRTERHDRLEIKKWSIPVSTFCLIDLKKKSSKLVFTK